MVLCAINFVKKLFFWFVLLAILGLCSLVGVSLSGYGGLRAPLVRDSGDPIILYDPEIGFVPNPASSPFRQKLDTQGKVIAENHSYTDSHGARASVPGMAGPSRPEILFGGSSYTWGLGVPNDQTFAARIGSTLGVPVENFGMLSYGFTQSHADARTAIAFASEAGGALVESGYVWP